MVSKNKKGVSMNDGDKVVKHLEIIQGVVNRAANNSLTLKLVATIVALFGALVAINTADYSGLLFLTPLVTFWFLDSYYLQYERIFRGIYNDVRQQEQTDFGMNVPAQLKKPTCKWRSTFFSKTILIFYVPIILFVGLLSI